MPHSPYLDLNRDLAILWQIVRDHEAAKAAKRSPAAPGRSDTSDIVWEPVYPKPVAASRDQAWF